MLERRLLMAQALLQGHRTDLGQERGVRLFFQLRQENAGVVVTDFLFVLVKRIGAIAQHRVPDKPHAPKRSRQQDFLLGRRVESVFVGAFGLHRLQSKPCLVSLQVPGTLMGATTL
ncbi:hypothetical protein VRRI112168_18700 [Vreelandella rituensis]